MTKNLQDQNSKIKECEKLSFLRNIYDDNIYVDNIILKSDRSNDLNVLFCRRQQNNFLYKQYNYGTGLK